MIEQTSSTRYTLAVLDNTIIDLSVEADSARKMAQEAETRAERLESFRARLMEMRDTLRPILDSSAPREYPYDKR
jgi:hypothetical protein